MTQRQRPSLAVVEAEFDPESDHLSLLFPDDEDVSGPVTLGEEVRTVIWGRPVPGRVVNGPWGEALSRYCGGPVRLIKTGQPGLSFDEFPLSILSQASIDLLNRITNGFKDFEAKRFRPNFLVDGCSPHEEDTWLDGIVSVGQDFRLRVIAPDPRCAITTVDPSTGQRDFDTPRLLLTYRPNNRAPYFGVYATVETPGTVSVGDSVEFLSTD